MAMKSNLVTLCILCKDEARMLDACLNYHERFFNNIVALDGNSTDGTREVLEKHGVRYESRELRSFAEDRNYLSGLAPTDWVLHVDCDELFDWETLNNLDSMARGRYAGYKVARLNIEPMDPNPQDYHIRLYDRTKASWGGDVHEVLLTPEGRTIDSVDNMTALLPNPMIHVLKHPKERVDRWERWERMHADPGKVAVCVLVKNQAKWLRRFLACLDDLDYSKRSLFYAFLEGDSTDGSLEILQEWAKFKTNVLIERMSMKEGGRMGKLAALHNRVVEMLKGRGFDYLLWVDADVMMPPGTLRELLKMKEDIAAPMVYIEGTRQFYDTLAFRKDGRRLRHTHPYLDGLVHGRKEEMTSVGTCYLVDAKVYEAGVRYHDGESEQLTFCTDARWKGFRIFLDTGLSVSHINLPVYGERWH